MSLSHTSTERRNETSRPSRDATDALVVLRHLMVLCADAVAGYRKAASLVVAAPRVRELLEENAVLREEIASVLRYEAIELGSELDAHGSIAGLLHRRWLDMLAVVEPGDTAALLRACARGERETIAAFSAALGRPLPPRVHRAVQSQLGRVLAASANLAREWMTARAARDL